MVAQEATGDSRGLRAQGGSAFTYGEWSRSASRRQRQRIALARALLSDPPILILDEATSMYDPEGEVAFVELCRSALIGRTVIIITHRPASLALADRILLVESGSIAEQPR